MLSYAKQLQRDLQEILDKHPNAGEKIGNRIAVGTDSKYELD